jgi:signal transduction histidine kinase
MGSAARGEPAVEPLRTIGEILSLPPEEFGSGRPVVVRGVVTLRIPFVIQDGDDGIYVEPRLPGGYPHYRDPDFAVGSEIEVEGVVDPGGYAPRIWASKLRHVGQRPLPKAAVIPVARLFGGGEAGCRVRVAGVVQGLVRQPECWTLILESESKRLSVDLSVFVFPEEPVHLFDARVSVTGVIASIRNQRGEFLAPNLNVARPEDIEVVVPSGGSPFIGDKTPLGDIGRYRRMPLDGERVRTQGVVSFALPGAIYLQDGIGGVRVDLAETEAEAARFRPGDLVEVAGFPDMSRGVGGLVWSVARVVGAGQPPEPERIQPSKIVEINDRHGRSGEVARPGTYDGCLIQCTGRVEAVDQSATATLVTLLENGKAFTAVVPPADAPRGAGIVPGSDVRVTGMVQMARPESGDATVAAKRQQVERFSLLLRGPQDIVTLRLPPWWTPARLTVMAGVLGAVALASILWVTFLRREVARQTARAVEEETARLNAAIDYEVTLRERNQLAANLHDTILQTVTGISFQLKVCEERGRRRTTVESDDDEFAPHLTVARKMVEHAAGQLRGTVWSLRSLPTEGQSFSGAMSDLVERFGSGHRVKIALEIDPAADDLPAYVTGNLILVLQEAIHNALHHAAPSRVDVRVAFAPTASSLEATVSDDGEGFELGTQAGPREGHFGLAGMRERIERIGGTFDIRTAPGRGTVIRAAIPAGGKTLEKVHARPDPDRTMPAAAPWS